MEVFASMRSNKLSSKISNGFKKLKKVCLNVLNAPKFTGLSKRPELKSANALPKKENSDRLKHVLNKKNAARSRR